MSGSGGSGNFGGGGSGLSSFDCQNVSIKTSIMSPNSKVLATIKVNDKLNINLQTATGPIVAVTNSREVLGSIFTTKLSDLINCINNGYSFQAVVLAISGGECEVLISATI